MEERIKSAMEWKNVTYLQLLRDVAISCEDFVLFLRQKSDLYGSNISRWPVPCGDIFSTVPVLTSFGTCFTTNPNYTLTTSSVGVTERITILLSTELSVVKRPEWLQDEALRAGVQISLSMWVWTGSVVNYPNSRKEHHVNSLFVNSYTLSPATNNLIAMTKLRTDRTAFHPDSADFLISADQHCSAGPDLQENSLSSLPLQDYNQLHCQRMKLMKKFTMMFNCTVLPLYGTLDLSEDLLPVCGREVMQKMMPMMRSISLNHPQCPVACLVEQVETENSFTLLSDESFNMAWKLWKLPGENRTKEDCVWVELYYKTLTTKVTKFNPMGILDILSNIGGTIGLFLGGSLFSIIESTAIAILMLISLLKTMLFFCNSQEKVQ